MLVMTICAVLAALGGLAVLRWGGSPVVTREVREPVRRWMSLIAGSAMLGIAAGALAGFLGAGPTSRLLMRLLALTSPESRRMITEGGATVGEITLPGTVALLGFVGISGGVMTGVLYMLLHRWLPGGRVGGATFGLVLLVLGGTHIEPLRADNIDFALVGPDWLSVLGFAAVAMFHGMVLAAIAGRLSRMRPLPAIRSGLITGRLALGAAVLIAMPSFATSVVDILRG